MKHTKEFNILAVNNDTYLLTINDNHHITENEAIANEKLFEAAPELLEALKDCLNDVTSRCTDLNLDCTKYSTWQKATQAIKKATQ